MNEKNNPNIQMIEGKKSEIIFMITEAQHVCLLYMGELQRIDENWVKQVQKQTTAFLLTQVQLTGDNIHHKGIKLSYSGTTDRLHYQEYYVEEKDFGKQVVIVEKDEKTGLIIHSFFQLFNDSCTIRTFKIAENTGDEAVGIEWLSSLTLAGILQINDFPNNYAEHLEFSVAHNAWTAELQWETRTLKEHGINFYVDGEHKQPSSQRINITNNSSWSCSEFSPSGVLFNRFTNQSAGWQIEHNGAWHYEIGDTGVGNLLYLTLFGPEEYDNHCWIQLKPHATFETVKTAYVQVNGDQEKVLDELTIYRRLIRRVSKDNQQLPIIFNDYMNCLMGEPTTEVELPLIDAAARAGCEYFVIDCGWYADGYWWDSVGEWLPSEKRFTNGINEVIKAIHKKGMISGLWLEIEVMGIHCPLADKLPDDWFFTRHGKRVIDIDRYHLDFRNKEVIAYADQVLDRLITDYGIGYIKMDYNITTGIGTDYLSDSYGEGLLAHNHAYLNWLDHLFQRYPDLVIENCGSGGMRHDYAMLSRHSLQSLTDQTDYLRNGAIAAVGASAVTPEQCAVWSYPLEDGDEEEVIYNMINSLLLRVHQSGYLNKLSDNRFKLVTEGLNVYKQIRQQILKSLPIWPTGLEKLDDSKYTFGLIGDRQLLLAVWNNKQKENLIEVDLTKYGKVETVTQIYPKAPEYQTTIFNVNNQVAFKFETAPSARLYKITLEK